MNPEKPSEGHRTGFDGTSGAVPQLQWQVPSVFRGRSLLMVGGVIFIVCRMLWLQVA